VDCIFLYTIILAKSCHKGQPMNKLEALPKAWPTDITTDPPRSAETSRGQHVYAQLTAAIQTGRLQPGTRLREVEIAAWLGVSRTPVREALKRLEADGLAQATPHAGMTVTTLSRQQIIELYAMRIELEGMAARLAAQFATDDEIATLQAHLRAAEATLDDAAASADGNRAFHACIYRASHNRYLLQTLDSLSTALALLPTTTYDIAGRPAAALAEHRAIVEAIWANAADEAEAAARAHMQGAQRARLKLGFNSP
jgi:DNA-binding GntR family transcriptional regulator